ncbi:hypothetical protein OROHE_004000 [Orobanche hederae]
MLIFIFAYVYCLNMSGRRVGRGLEMAGVEMQEDQDLSTVQFDSDHGPTDPVRFHLTTKVMEIAPLALAPNSLVSPPNPVQEVTYFTGIYIPDALVFQLTEVTHIAHENVVFDDVLIRY